VPTEEIENVKGELEKQFEKRGFFLSQELEAVISRISMKYLIK